MTATLIFAIIAMLLAAVLYTIAVFGELAARILKPWHLALLWLGLAFDTTGTTLMSHIAGGQKWDLHGVVGILAFALMLIHSVWARIAVTFKQERVLRSFHRFSVHVQALWMAALVSGIVLVAALSPGLSPGTEQCKKADSQLSLSHVPADTKVDAL